MDEEMSISPEGDSSDLLDEEMCICYESDGHSDPQAREAEERRKEQQLEDLRNNATTLLTLAPVSEPFYMENVVHELKHNTSVKRLLFSSSNYAYCDETSTPMTEGEWSLLIKALQPKNQRNSMVALKIAETIPFIVIPTMLWQFRNLKELILVNSTNSPWQQEQWQVLSAAIQDHPSLKTFAMKQKLKVQFSKNDVAWSPNDAMAMTLATSVPSLREYTQKGLLHNTGVFDATDMPQLSVASVAALIRCPNLVKLQYCRSGFTALPLNPSILVHALQASTLLELSLKGNNIDAVTTSLILRGVRVNSTIVKLDLSENDIGSQSAGVSALLMLLGTNKTLLHLDVSICGLTSYHFIQIVSALRCNNSLVSLKLGEWKKSTKENIDERLFADYEDPSSRLLLSGLLDLLAKNNTSLRKLNLATTDFSMDFDENESRHVKEMHAVATTAGMIETQAIISKCQFWLKLNCGGRSNLVGAAARHDRNEWMNALVEGRNDVGVLDSISFGRTQTSFS